MARIVIITHAYDDYCNSDYLLRELCTHWIDAGHMVHVVAGTEGWPAADIAILHVDLSVVPIAYAEACKRYPVVVNGAARDIRKSLVSRHLVRPGDGWSGPVIVKTDLNCGGLPEVRAAKGFKRDGTRPDLAMTHIVCTARPYQILRDASVVPAAVWNNPGLVVERFLPERDARGYWLGVWVFFGARERCARYLGMRPILKGSDLVAREPTPVPELLRAERERLGFDYGKFDFVVHDNQPVLLDANRTPGAPPSRSNPAMHASYLELAQGIDDLLRI